MTDVDTLATFDFATFFAAVDDARRDRDMGWYDLADELWISPRSLTPSAAITRSAAARSPG